MPLYQYIAVNHAGEKQQGEVFANSQAQLNQSLNKKGLWLLRFKDIKSKTTESHTKISRRELIDLFSSFTTMLEAGVSLLETISTIEQHISNEALKHTLNLIRLDVESGISLSIAMSKHSALFPKQVTSVVKAGEHSGQLSASFSELQKYYEWLENLIGDIKQASTYPLIIFVVVCLFVLLLFTFVVPRFTALLSGLGIALPFITVLVMDISQFTLQYWWLILGLPITLWFLVKSLYRHSTNFARQIDELKLQVPIFGDINRMISLSRFTHHFSIMFRSGIQILDCLKHCRALVGNAKLAAIISGAEKSVREGRNMSEALAKHNVFPPMLLQMIKVGESTGELDAAMSQVSQYYDKEIPRQIKRTFSILEPMIMLLLIGIVGSVAIAIFLPMVSMLGGLK